jgi:hypothetical protein
MTDQHRATPEQWEVVEICREDGKIPWWTATALLELRARIEALEAAQQDKLDRLIALDRDDPTPDAAMDELRAASAEARPAGLVEQLAVLITSATTSRGAAQDVLREVAAAALQMAPDKNLTMERVALWLEREANQ